MKIAIVSMFGHYECLGFLCEVLQEHEITLYIGNNSRGEEHSICRLYSNVDVVNVIQNLNKDFISLYDVVFKLSSNDHVIHHPKVISLLHLSTLKDVSDKYISLSPFVVGDNVSYMLPVYNPGEIQICYNKAITFVGYFSDSWVDEDLQCFIENSNHTFNFVVWGGDSYNKLASFTNVKVYHNISDDNLKNLINNSSYILLRSASYINYDRFTGMIALALSFKKPLIVDRRTKEAYKIPGIVYEKQYSELIYTLNNEISASVYETLVGAISDFNNEVITKNKLTINNLLLESK